jgi:hypothetical protein
MYAWLFSLAALAGGDGETNRALPSPARPVSRPDARPVPLYISPQETIARRFSYRLRHQLEVIYRQPILQSDTTFSYAQIGLTSMYIGQQRPLSHDLYADIEAGLSYETFSAPVSLSWYPIEGLQLSIGYDLLRWRVVASACFTP